jgi:hypothetical protein
VIGINPFDQPDVEASKIKTRALTDAYEKTGKLNAFPKADPGALGTWRLYADPGRQIAKAPAPTRRPSRQLSGPISSAGKRTTSASWPISTATRHDEQALRRIG